MDRILHGGTDTGCAQIRGPHESESDQCGTHPVQDEGTAKMSMRVWIHRGSHEIGPYCSRSTTEQFLG